MSNLTSGQRWVLIAIAYAAVVIVATQLFEGSMTIVVIVLASFAVAAYAVLNGRTIQNEKSS